MEGHSEIPKGDVEMLTFSEFSKLLNEESESGDLVDSQPIGSETCLLLMVRCHNVWQSTADQYMCEGFTYHR